MIILEELDFEWKDEDVTSVQAMWKKGLGLVEISQNIKHRPEEVFLLLMDLNLKGKIKNRRGFIWGSCKNAN